MNRTGSNTTKFGSTDRLFHHLENWQLSFAMRRVRAAGDGVPAPCHRPRLLVLRLTQCLHELAPRLLSIQPTRRAAQF
jgi:hypothetical protein